MVDNKKNRIFTKDIVLAVSEDGIFLWVFGIANSERDYPEIYCGMKVVKIIFLNAFNNNLSTEWQEFIKDYGIDTVEHNENNSLEGTVIRDGWYIIGNTYQIEKLSKYKELLKLDEI